MYHSILVPLDGSQFAEQALPLAVSIATRAGASLRIVQVEGLYALEDPHCSWAPYDREENRAFRKQKQVYLDAIVKRLQTAARVPVTSTLISGLDDDAIVKWIRTALVDLVVMTTHGGGPVNRFWIARIAIELARHGPVPVLLVRPREAAEDLALKPTVNRILIPLDGSKLAEGVLEPAIALGSVMDAEYTLLRAVEPSSFLDGLAAVADPCAIERASEERKAEAQAYLDRLAEGLRADGKHVQTEVVLCESAAAILAAARDQSIDLIAIATHGRSGLRRLFLGSVAGKIVRGTFTPVLVYRPITNG
jgi:nucleotide-binding universal stress UspA family protein